MNATRFFASPVLRFLGSLAHRIIGFIIRSAHGKSGFWPPNCPRQLLSELCEAHRLSHRERMLITRLAQYRSLPVAAVLFVEPSLWDEPLPADIPAAELSRLRLRVFSR